ncbi:hypothetical protein SC828_09090 [Legionella pneumophila serogroup 1]
MKIYVEGEIYDETIVPIELKTYFWPISENQMTTDFVGYYNNYTEQPIFFLPKIFSSLLKSNTNDILIDLATKGLENAHFRQTGLNRQFLSRFVFSFYLSLVKFVARNQNSSILKESSLSLLSSRTIKDKVSELEIVFSLLDFYSKHKDLLQYKAKESFGSYKSKINWNKTIRKQSPLCDENNLIYTRVSNNETFISLDNELLMIYYSLLKYLKSIFGFSIEIDPRYSKMKTSNYERFVKSSRNILKKIKGKYFDDRFKKLYQLLGAYFDLVKLDSCNKFKKEFLLVRNYNIVFEDMIDLLLSNNDIYDNLKNQKDGKVVDHIYLYESLLGNDDIFYIGDSKYYKDSTVLGRASIYKQFTYAKNVIQFNIDLFHEGKYYCQYRDELTEGYNISPNFFINAFIDDHQLTKPKPKFEVDKSIANKTLYHFSNRVFDRDTLRMCSFKLNFLFVLYAYTLEKRSMIISFQSQVYKKVRKYFIDYYNEHYDFYKILSFDDVELFINKHFKTLNGKIYRTKLDVIENSITLGLAKHDDENNKVLLAYLTNQSVIRKIELQ